MVEEIETAMKGMLAPEVKEVVTGQAEIRQVIIDAVANKTSASVIPPAVERITFTLTPSTSIFSSDALTASAVP